MSDNYLEMLLKELEKNGVSLRKLPFNPDKFTLDELEIEAIQFESFNFLDFSERDSGWKKIIDELKQENKEKLSLLEKLRKEYEVSENYIAELKKRIAELERKENVKTMRIEFHEDNGEMLTPLEVANSLIKQNTFKVDELRELAEHLQVYCRHHNDKEKDAISF